MAYAPPDKDTTRAPYHSILLERPLTKGEMRANVLWRARRWAGMMNLHTFVYDNFFVACLGAFLLFYVLSHSSASTPTYVLAQSGGMGVATHEPRSSRPCAAADR